MKRKQMLALLLSVTLIMGIASPVYAEDDAATQATTETEVEDVTTEPEVEVEDTTETTQEPKAEEIGKEEVPESEEVLPPMVEQPTEETAETLVAEDIVTVPDANLKKELLKKCGKKEGEQLSKADMESITDINLYNSDAGTRLDLTGLEYCMNLNSLRLFGYFCDNSDKLNNLSKMKTLELSNGDIAETSFLKGMPQLEYLSLDGNKSVDMDALKDLSQLTYLNLTGCNVEDISSLSKLSKLERLILSNNKIVDISVLSNLNYINYLDLSGNTGITDISILEKYKAYIGVNVTGNDNITKEYLFKTFMNPKITTVVGNEISLGLDWIKRISITGGSLTEEDIEWKVADSKIATVTKDFSIIGQAAGKTKITGRIGNTTKTFDVEVVGLESEVVEASPKGSETKGLQADVCTVLDNKKVLWSINQDKTEQVKTGVKSYIANIVYGTSRAEAWARFYVLDTNKTLWDCNKNTKSAAYTTEKLFSNVKEYDHEYVLLTDGKLYKINDSKTPVGEKIVSYQVNYSHEKKDYIVDDIILNTSQQLINRTTGAVYLADVDEVQFAWSSTYLALQGNTLYIYRKEGTDLKLYRTVKGVSEVTTTNFVKEDGSVWEWNEDDPKLNPEKKWDKKPIYAAGSYDSTSIVLDSDYVLSMYDSKGGLIQKKEDVKEVIYRYQYEVRILMNNGEYLEYVKESNDWKTIATNVKKVIALGTFYITNDNVLHQITPNGTYNKVMTDVRDAINVVEDCYITRTDNSVWRYCAFASGNGKPYLVKEGDKPAPPVDEVFKDVPVGQWYNESVQFVYGNNIMTGLDATNFGPTDTLARAQFAVILYRLAGEPDVKYEAKFPDVPAGIWYTDAVMWASNAGIITGYSDTKLFGAGDRINREQMAVMMYRYAKYQKYDTSQTADFSKFKDAALVNDFAKEAMQWAVATKIITGKDKETRIDPQGNANRAECATIIMRFMKFYA